MSNEKISLPCGVVLTNVKQPFSGGNIYASVELNGKHTEVTYITRADRLSIMDYVYFSAEEIETIKREVVKYIYDRNKRSSAKL